MLKKMFLSVILLILGVMALGNFSPAYALDTGNVSLMDNEPGSYDDGGPDDDTPGPNSISMEEVYLGSYTAAEFKAGLQSKELIVTVYTEDWSPVVQSINADPASSYLVRSVTPVVTLPYTVSPNLNGAKIHLANVVLGSDGYLPAGRYSAKIAVTASFPDGRVGGVAAPFTFDIIDGGSSNDNNGNNNESEMIYLGEYTAAELKAGLPAKKLFWDVNLAGSNVSAVMTGLYAADTKSESLIRAFDKVRLPYTFQPNVSASYHIANVTLGTNDTLPVDRYYVYIRADVSEGGAQYERISVAHFVFDIVESGGGGAGGTVGLDSDGTPPGGYGTPIGTPGGSGYDGPTNLRDAIGCSASGLGVFGVLALAGLALAKRRRH